MTNLRIGGLLRKFICSYREYGFGVSLRKCYNYIRKTRQIDIENANVMRGVESAPVLCETAFANKFDRDVAVLRFFMDRHFHPLLIITNGLRGGSALWLKQYSKFADRTVLYVRPLKRILVLELQHNDFLCKIKVPSLELLLRHGLLTNCEEMLISHFLQWEQYFGQGEFGVKAYNDFIDMVSGIQQQIKVRTTFVFHDFFSICPSFHLLNTNNRFCHPDRDVSGCAPCAGRSLHLKGLQTLDEIKAWRETAKRLFSICDELRFFSESSRDIVSNVVPVDMEKTTVVPHQPIEALRPVVVENTSCLRIGIIGDVNSCKGAGFIADFADYLSRVNPAARIVIFGVVEHQAFPPNVVGHGQYEHAQLPELVRQHGVNIGFVSSICPETFSYATLEFMQMEIPTACFNIGAPVERLRSWPRGVVIPEITVSSAYETIRVLFDRMYSTPIN